MEFSNVANATYYFAKVQSGSSATSPLILEFYKGKTDRSLTPVGLNVSIAMETEQYTPLVWHLLPVEK